MTEERDPFLTRMFAESAEPLDGEAFVNFTMRQIRPRWRVQQFLEIAAIVALFVIAFAVMPLATSALSEVSQALSMAAALLKPAFTPPYIYVLGAALGLFGLVRRWA